MMVDTTLDAGYSGGLTLSPVDTANLRKAGRWGRFLGIVSMVLIGLFIVLLIGFGSTMFAMMALMSGGGGGGAGGDIMVTMMIVIYVIAFAFSFYMAYLLYKFGAEAVTAVDNGDGAAMTRSFASLGRMFKIYGIVAVIYLGFIAISLLLALVGGGLAAFGNSSY